MQMKFRLVRNVMRNMKFTMHAASDLSLSQHDTKINKPLRWFRTAL